MNRRIFLSLGVTISSASAFFGFFGTDKDDKWRVLQSVQNHLFPHKKGFPDAQSINSIRYLKMVSRDDSFDQKDMKFIFEGVEELEKIGWQINLSKSQKEKILVSFSQTTFGENWISLVLNYTFEALLSDPLYGGNKNQLGWKSLKHHAGQPRPKVRFGQIL